MANLFSTWLVFLQAVLLCSTIEPGITDQCGTTKFVVVDDVKKPSDLTIPYDICKVERPTCFVSNHQLCDGKPLQESATIKKAQFVDKNGKVNTPLISHDSRHFTISLKGEDFTIGVYNYSVSYYYETDCLREFFQPTLCHGWIHSSLIIVVTDVRLSVVSNVLILESKEDITQKTFHVKEDGSINLECSLGLASHQELLNMRLKFVFTSTHSNAEKSVVCNESNPQTVDNWVVTPNMNDNTCHLKVMKFSEADGGRYDCLLVLTNSHTSYNQDKSNVIVLASLKKQNYFGQFEIGVFYGILGLIIAIIVAFSAIVVVRIKSWCKPQRLPLVPVPGPTLASSRYGSNGETNIRRDGMYMYSHNGIDGEPIVHNVDTPYQTEGENDSEAETVFSGPDTPATSQVTDSESLRSDEDLAQTRQSTPGHGPVQLKSSCTCKICTKTSGIREVMSEVIHSRRESISLNTDGLSPRLCQYFSVGYKIESHQYPSKTSQTCKGDPCNSGSRHHHDSSRLSMPDIPHLLEEPDEPQVNHQNTESVVSLHLPESDTGSSGGQSSSSGKNTPDQEKQQPTQDNTKSTLEFNCGLLEQRDGSCCENERNDSD